jgi:hypothetical protein
VPKSFFSGSVDAVGKHRTQAFKFAVYQYSHRAFASDFARVKLFWTREVVRRNAGKQKERIMQNTETHQINEFELIDDHGNEYTIFEYQEGIEKRSLKWIATTHKVLHGAR